MQSARGKYLAQPIRRNQTHYTRKPTRRPPSLNPQPHATLNSHRSTSVNSMYSNKVNEITARDIRQLRAKYPIIRVKAMEGASQEKLKEEALRQVGKNKHKNSVTYAEQLRLTLLKQYQNMKSNSPRTSNQKRGRNKSTQALGQHHTIQVMEGSDNSECRSPTASPTRHSSRVFPSPPAHYAYSPTPGDPPTVHSEMLPYSKQAMAYSTLNMLYQAIIDNSLQRRKKEEFELQARQLPIVDRFTRKQGVSLMEDTFYMERSLVTGQRRKSTLNMVNARSKPIPHFTSKFVPEKKQRVVDLRNPKARTERKQLPQEYEIVPWGVEELGQQMLKQTHTE